MFREENVLWYL